MISVPYIAFTDATSTEGMGLPLHSHTMLIIPEVHSEMACFIMSVQSSSLTSSKPECWVCDGCEVKQPFHSRCIFEDINDDKIAIMMSLDFSNESGELVLSLSIYIYIYILSVYSPFSDRVGLPLHNIHIPSPFSSIMDNFFVDLKLGHIYFYTL